MKVLLADDSAMVRRSLVAMLSRVNEITSISEAENGEETIGLIDTEQFDILILDIQMPGKNGINVLEHIEAQNIQTNVIVLTNYSVMPYRKKCSELGAEHFLNKSSEFKMLPKIIKDIAIKKMGK